jgi:hypothetical protein
LWCQAITVSLGSQSARPRASRARAAKAIPTECDRNPAGKPAVPAQPLPSQELMTLYRYGQRQAGTAFLAERDGRASRASRRSGDLGLTILCGRGAEDKRKATGSILGHRAL